MPAAVDSAFELAFWFCDRALNDNEYLQPIKLHYLMFLAQAYYATAYQGKKLIPAIFVAEEVGPIEPSVFRAWSQGRPKFEGKNTIHEEAATFADSVWRRFGHHSVEHLGKFCRQTPCYLTALDRGRRAEIHLNEMITSFSKSQNAPPVDQVVKPKIMRSHKGRAVEVKGWVPRSVKPEK